MSGDMTMGALASKFLLAAKGVDTVSDVKLRTLAQAGVGFVKGQIQAMHAVDTGTMLNSTVAERADKSSYLIGPTVFYAPYVALGTKHMAARPFHIAAAKQLDAAAKDLFNADDLGL